MPCGRGERESYSYATLLQNCPFGVAMAVFGLEGESRPTTWQYIILCPPTGMTTAEFIVLQNIRPAKHF